MRRPGRSWISCQNNTPTPNTQSQTIMTRKHFRRLISGIYLISTGIGISISLIALYSKLGSDYSTPLTWLAVFEFWTLLLPALVTCIIVGLVRLTNKIEPLSEEERQQSFVERLSKTQLFIPLSLLLAVPSAFLASTIPDIWIRGFFRVSPFSLRYIFLLPGCWYFSCAEPPVSEKPAGK